MVDKVKKVHKVAIIERVDGGKTVRLLDMQTGFVTVDEAKKFVRVFNTTSRGSARRVKETDYIVYARLVGAPVNQQLGQQSNG